MQCNPTDVSLNLPQILLSVAVLAAGLWWILNYTSHEQQALDDEMDTQNRVD